MIVRVFALKTVRGKFDFFFFLIFLSVFIFFSLILLLCVHILSILLLYANIVTVTQFPRRVCSTYINIIIISSDHTAYTEFFTQYTILLYFFIRSKSRGIFFIILKYYHTPLSVYVEHYYNEFRVRVHKTLRSAYKYNIYCI